jgi:hypothetical protein
VFVVVEFCEFDHVAAIRVRSCSQQKRRFAGSFGFPVAQISFLKQRGTGDTPAEFGVVGKSDSNVENAFLEGVVCPMDDLPLDAWILLALHHFARREFWGGHFSFGHD